MTLSSLPLMAVVGGAVILSLYAGRLARKTGLPSLVGYMILGVILGSSVLGVLSAEGTRTLSFLTDIALGFVAFTIGSELNLRELKKLGKGIIYIILAESFAAFFMVAGAVWILTGNLPMALIFGALAPASAPAGTVAVIQEYGAKGKLTSALYAVVGFDDGLAIIIFGFASAAARNILDPAASSGLMHSVLHPAGEILFSILAGGFLGVLLTVLGRKLRPLTDVPSLFMGFVAVAAGIAQWLHLSLILTCMMLGFVLTNTTPVATVKSMMGQLRTWMPFLFIPFFFLAGAHLDIAALPSLGLIGVVYILARTAGLMGGARLGAVIGRSDDNIKKYLGFGILSQAGVAIGLSMVVLGQFEALGTPEASSIAVNVITTITATCIIFEIIGPIGAKYALQKAGEIRRKT
ncbi:MAG TPA: cation:proton antiporter [Candidatus Sabulitectum sp.]|nr:cation:proton antiporter [Candidatus Sabulitectum sp.]HPR21231.1 cation:proton antiporter [Candidatus Sabulitectum sp.]